MSYSHQISEDTAANATLLQQHGEISNCILQRTAWIWNFHENGLEEVDLLLGYFIPFTLFRSISSSGGA
jgi:hypothetical protein